MEIKERLIKGNELFQKEMSSNSEMRNLNLSLVNKQSPFCLVITCSDSRVIPERIFNCDLGDLFVIRTAGNAINEGELASIEYGLEHLNIKCLIVLGHTHCGAIHAAIHKEKDKYLSPVLDNIFSYICGVVDEKEASIINAKEQAKYIKSKFLDLDCEIIPALYDIETNKVTFYE